MPNAIEMYVLKTGEKEARLQPVQLSVGYDEYVGAIQRMSLFSGSVTDSSQFIHTNTVHKSASTPTAIWIDCSGTVHVIPTHHHSVTAFYALARNCEPDFELLPNTWPKSALNYLDLTQISGILKAEYFSSKGKLGGLNVSVAKEYPPNTDQLRAIIELYQTTNRAHFVAEMYENKLLIECIHNPIEVGLWFEPTAKDCAAAKS